MSSDDQRAKDLVIKTLKEPGIHNIKFKIGAYDINYTSFLIVLLAVWTGKITVKHDDKIGRGAYYDSGKNQLTLGFVYAGTLSKSALIVHECTHAAMDADPQKFKFIDHATSEAAGYIAQCMYKLVTMAEATQAESVERIKIAHAGSDKIFRHAWNIALAYRTDKTPSSHDLVELELALKNHKWYKNKIDKIAGFDGVRQRSAHAGHSHAH